MAANPTTNVADLLAQPGPSYAVPRSSRAMRPETDVFARVSNRYLNTSWVRAIRRLQDEVYPLIDEAHAECFARRDDESGEIVWVFFQTMAIIFYEQDRAGVAGLSRREDEALYRQPCSNSKADEAVFKPPPARDLKLMLEFILCVDYGITPTRLSSVAPASLRSFTSIAMQLSDFAERRNAHNTQANNDIAATQQAAKAAYIASWRIGLDVTDVALMLYHFSRNTGPSVSLCEGNYWGFDHYKPYMDELKDGVATRGTDRLLRKLSVDINDVIPTVVFDWERKKSLQTAANLIAAAHNLDTLTMDRAYPPPTQAQQQRQRPGGAIRMAGMGLNTGVGDAMSRLTDDLMGRVVNMISQSPVACNTGSLNRQEKDWGSEKKQGTARDGEQSKPQPKGGDLDDEWELIDPCDET